MVAYSFKQRFVEPIRRGLEPGPWVPGMKRQTVRAFPAPVPCRGLQGFWNWPVAIEEAA